MVMMMMMMIGFTTAWVGVGGADVCAFKLGAIAMSTNSSVTITKTKFTTPGMQVARRRPRPARMFRAGCSHGACKRSGVMSRVTGGGLRTTILRRY
eukprot:364570-Chlamydomonas_euryale.AAC.23